MGKQQNLHHASYRIASDSASRIVTPCLAIGGNAGVYSGHKKRMSSSALFKINRPTVIDEAFDDEVVVINLDTGSYFSLDKAAADIWVGVASGATANEVVAYMQGKYAADLGTLESAVNRFLAELRAENLIVADINENSEGAAKLPTPSPAMKLTFELPVMQKYTDMQELLLIDPIHEVDDSGWPRSKPKSPDGK
jgi:coenzyme PQQ synthesis protein D (PqqD)